MQWIYLSPHLDDVALSAGGLVWEQSRRGEQVAIWTICAGDPPAGSLSTFAASLHDRWGVGQEAMAVRRVEDIQSCQVLGAAYRHFEIPDCIYRRSPISQQHLYDSEEALWIPPHSDEAGLVAQISSWMRAVEDKEVQWVCPLSLGGHVDHRLTRQAAQQAGVPLWFYADYPYVLSTQDDDWEAGMTGASFPVSGTGLLAWQQAVATHQSQISTFWNSLAEMRAALTSYCQRWDGVRLWRF